VKAERIGVFAGSIRVSRVVFGVSPEHGFRPDARRRRTGRVRSPDIKAEALNEAKRRRINFGDQFS
jgi:hypothetical protein